MCFGNASLCSIERQLEARSAARRHAVALTCACTCVCVYACMSCECMRAGVCVRAHARACLHVCMHFECVCARWRSDKERTLHVSACESVPLSLSLFETSAHA